jgi:hypothetical protein
MAACSTAFYNENAYVIFTGDSLFRYFAGRVRECLTRL